MTDVTRLHAIMARAEGRFAPSAPMRWRVQASASDLEIYLYGPIADDLYDDSEPVDALCQRIRAATGQIDVRINSPGGAVWDGLAIHTALVETGGHVTTHVDGVAASAASFVAQAGDRRMIARAASMMIHDAWGLTIGSARAHRDAADVLDDVSDAMAEIYADRSGAGTPATFRAAMGIDTWYRAEQAIAAGLADEIVVAPTRALDERTRMVRARLHALGVS